ncbi:MULTISPECIES: amino acid ABC transporter permease [Olsenella]|uniref:amino acid ABC transporter permease n=1 Tax=Olsenella TaxID=133925 RepID=UPI00071D8826|nr:MULTISPECIES: amino acid ABC transporter permease [Olsenella]OFK23726.1 amino acid ABC transporter permease [Olsenella sp. HMSC062G07]
MGFAELISQYGGRYLTALLTTWGMTAVSYLVAMALALVVTVMRVCPIKPLRVLGDGYVQVFRNIPGVSLLVLVVYSLPHLGLVLDYLTSVIVVVSLVASAFGSENFMSGINTIQVGQIEAARSLGFGFGQIMRQVVIPQALRSVVLPMTNLLIAVMLTTSLGSQVPLSPNELTGLVSTINTHTTGGIAAFAISALGYALTSVVIGWVGNRIDRRVRILR